MTTAPADSRKLINSVVLGLLVPLVCAWIGVAWSERMTIRVTNGGAAPLARLVLYGLDGEGVPVVWEVERLEPGATATSWYRRPYSVDVGSVHFSRGGRRFMATTRHHAPVSEGEELSVAVCDSSVTGTLRGGLAETHSVEFGFLDVTPPTPQERR